MADFYSSQLTENSDGTTTNWHSLGSGNFYGVSVCHHTVVVTIPIGTSFDAGDKVILTSVPSNINVNFVYGTHTAWSSGSTAKLGIYKVNTDGTIGAKASAGSDVAFGPASHTLTSAATVADLTSTNAAITIYDQGKQLWEFVNLLDAGTYASDPGGQLGIAFEFIGNPATTTVEQKYLLDISFNRIG